MNGICPECKKAVAVTKDGRIKRHGYKRMVTTGVDGWRGGYCAGPWEVTETKGACPGSGRGAVDLSKRLSIDEFNKKFGKK